jgi:hypothetical protein
MNISIILDASGNVLMWSETGTPMPPDGCQLVELTDEQAAAFLQRPPNDGLTFSNGVFGWIAPRPAPPPPTVDQKLGQIGLSLADLQTALNQAAIGK